jgi:enoyl-CoA hydratase/carnithine racemase
VSSAKPHIQSRLSNQIGYVLINRPESHNAISRQMWLDIPTHMQQLMKEGARILVIEGCEGAFAAGADVYELQSISSLEEARLAWDAIEQALDFVHSFPLPTIAAINGACLGGGCLLASSCDLRYASKRSRFSVPIAKLGIVIDDTTLGRLAALIGVSRCKELIYRAAVIDAQRAYDWGLLNDVFADEAFDESMQNIYSQILQNSDLSIKEAKTSFSRFTALATSHSENEQLVVASYIGPDFRQRVGSAFRKA